MADVQENHSGLSLERACDFKAENVSLGQGHGGSRRDEPCGPQPTSPHHDNGRDPDREVLVLAARP